MERGAAAATADVAVASGQKIPVLTTTGGGGGGGAGVTSSPTRPGTDSQQSSSQSSPSGGGATQSSSPQSRRGNKRKNSSGEYSENTRRGLSFSELGFITCVRVLVHCIALHHPGEGA